MLNLTRVELGKFFKGKAFWIVTLIYFVCIIATFVSLSFTQDLGLPESSKDILLAIDTQLANDLETALDDLNTVNALKSSGENFISEFYNYSSGQPTVLMIFLVIFLFADFLNGTLQATMLAGYSRKQIYISKFLCCILGSWVFYIVSMIIILALGAGFYAMPLNGAVLNTALTALVAQCVVAVELVAVFTAFGFFFGNGWAFLASTLILGVLPSIPLLAAYTRGQEHSFVASFLPSVITVNGIGSFVTLEQMLVKPSGWTPEFLAAALLVWVVISVGFTFWGMRAFDKKQL